MSNVVYTQQAIKVFRGCVQFSDKTAIPVSVLNNCGVKYIQGGIYRIVTDPSNNVIGVQLLTLPT